MVNRAILISIADQTGIIANKRQNRDKILRVESQWVLIQFEYLKLRITAFQSRGTDRGYTNLRVGTVHFQAERPDRQPR
jgi:hypothetical protein